MEWLKDLPQSKRHSLCRIRVKRYIVKEIERSSPYRKDYIDDIDGFLNRDLVHPSQILYGITGEDYRGFNRFSAWEAMVKRWKAISNFRSRKAGEDSCLKCRHLYCKRKDYCGLAMRMFFKWRMHLYVNPTIQVCDKFKPILCHHYLMGS